jgi:hypothetical protein
MSSTEEKQWRKSSENKLAIFVNQKAGMNSIIPAF